jgi:membrane-associated phospholipid phosphatase
MPSSSSAASAGSHGAPLTLPRALALAPRGLGSRAKVALALLAAALCLLALAATWVLAELVPAAHLRDAILLYRFTELGRPHIDALANGLLALLSPLLYTVWALLIVGVALLRRRPRVALAVAIVLPAAPLSAELLKPLLAHPHASVDYVSIGSASWPSGHATAAATLVLCALLVAPRWLRPTVAALGGAFVVAVGVSLLVLAWHMPSDVLGGYLLAALYASLAAAALYRRPAGLSPPPGRLRARRGPTGTPRPR